MDIRYDASFSVSGYLLKSMSSMVSILPCDMIRVLIWAYEANFRFKD